MNTIRKSTLTALIAAAVCAPLAATAADFTIQDDASQPTPFSRPDTTQYPKPTLGAPQFITQELIATSSGGVAYDRVNGRWVHVHANGDHDVPKPDLMGTTFTQHNG